MTFARDDQGNGPDMFPRVPAWVTSARIESPQDVAFLSEAALSYLYVILRHHTLPQALLRDRPAPRAAGSASAGGVPKLRAKEARKAVDLFLARDALAPIALPSPDRAAWWLCDRLVELGAVRELTGRDTFRLYGL